MRKGFMTEVEPAFFFCFFGLEQWEMSLVSSWKVQCHLGNLAVSFLFVAIIKEYF